MPSVDTETRNFQGLFLQQNSFNVPDGAFEQAVNVQIQSDGIIQKTKGFYTYYGAPSLDIRGLYEYEDVFIAADSNTSALYWFSDDTSFDTRSPVGVATVLPGELVSFFEVGLSRSAKQALNLYFTNDFGVYKLEDFAGPVRKTGVPPALDLSVEPGSGSTGPIPADSNTSWRALFGRRDENGNLFLGAPSDIASLSTPEAETAVAWTRSGSGPFTITLSLTTNDGWVSGQEILVSGSSSPSLDGLHTITVVPLSPTDISFTVAVDPGAASGTLDISFSRTATLRTTIPLEINSTADGWFVRWYRTSSSATLSVSPSPDFALIGETILTAADIASRYVTFLDDVDPSLIGAELYTNPNSQEGEAQANARPPFAMDITLYNTYMIYANVETRQFISLQLFAPPTLVNYAFSIKLGSTIETYLSASGVGNVKTPATSVGPGLPNQILITYVNHGASNGWQVYISDVTGTLPPGLYTVVDATLTNFQIVAPGVAATALSFEFISTGSTPVFTVDSTSTSPAQQIANTAQNLVKAINRSSALFYANYVSTFEDSPGKIRISTNEFDFNNDMAVADNFNQAESYWTPPLPPNFSSGVQVKADPHHFPDTLYFSKTDEPEAVPVVNFARVGSKNKAIKRIFPLRDCLIILKEDGVFVLTGQVIPDFNVSTLDATVFFESDRTADKISNTVIALSSNQGVVQVTEKSVQIISRRIDDVIQPILGFDVPLSVSLGFGYESGRTYYMSINGTILDRPPFTLLYNVLNQTWTASDLTFRQMLVGPADTVYATTTDEQNVILRQRKSSTLVDFSSEFMTASAVGIDQFTIQLTLTGGGTVFSPEAGDVIVFNEVINRIVSFVSDGGGGFFVTFNAITNIPSTGGPVDVIIYEGFTSTVKMSPFHGGAVGREKQFSAFQIHLRQNSISELSIDWGGAYFPTSTVVDWSNALRGTAASGATGSGGGWGFEPWGLFPWGLANSINLTAGTTPGIIIRTWVSAFAQRNTFIQALINHRQAAEGMYIQSVGYAVRGYQDRTTR